MWHRFLIFAVQAHYLYMTNGRLLWVDDEIEFLSVHILFHQKKGYEVTTCTNGPDALDLCAEQNFDLILLDENMPGLSGLETLQRIKDLQPDVPVVMVTKNEEENIMNQAIGSKIADYLLKPVNPMQILLTLKKNIHLRQIQQETAQSNYRQAFNRISMQISDTSTPSEWKELYRQLVFWELELADADESMADMLRMQKAEANQTFSKYVARNYENWINNAADRPVISPDVFKHYVFPSLSAGRKVFLIVIDNLRYDQWRTLSRELAPYFDIEEDLYFSILPTATQYARNAIFAGMMPLQIKRQYPDLWIEETEEESKNLHEEDLMRRQLERFRRREAISYHKFNDSATPDTFRGHLRRIKDVPLNVMVINFIDILSHARTESKMVRELAGNEAAYRSITHSWFLHSGIKSLFEQLAEMDFEVAITTDHGSLRVEKAIRVVGDRNVNTNLRYKLGKSLNYNPKEVFEMAHPERFGLPSPNVSTRYIYATGSDFFAYPNNYNYYVQYYHDTFQHGGISMEEMIVPYVRLYSKRRGG